MIAATIQDDLRAKSSKQLIELRGEFHAKVKRCEAGYLPWMLELWSAFEEYCDIELKARWSVTV